MKEKKCVFWLTKEHERDTMTKSFVFSIEK